ncbi:GLYCOSYL HYDROLASES FAMILY 16 PROTEIN EXPRESSED [Salix purpurea]|uniref:GLYCOSYL HYDROLASES FAMILY 16 PROTEIN EXPRESSED n=1 Tax=Salix purpurea TaxID=77065 RepID=A0A9Q0P118_SALPP|nr:GLYCOSYL HYDROLASES FAMILY 16 PROTEIN EXPRESSED [Salix purpurea]
MITAVAHGGEVPPASLWHFSSLVQCPQRKDKTTVQTNYCTSGTGRREEIHDLGFDFSDGFHECVMKWCPNFIEYWLIYGNVFGMQATLMRHGGLNLMWGVMHDCDKTGWCGVFW